MALAGEAIMIPVETFVHVLDLGGTFVFAISGAVAAVNRRLDIFGIAVLSFVAGNFGGIGRDLLIGAVPPAALTDVRYLLVSVLAGLITFFLYAGVDRLRSPVLWFDAAGLSFFAVAGAQKAIQFGLSPVMSALLGMLTGIGGGITRDVLLAEIPPVLIYTPLQHWPARPSSSSATCLVFPTASRLPPEGLCASAFVSWRSNTAGICQSRIFPRKDARASSVRTTTTRTKDAVRVKAGGSCAGLQSADESRPHPLRVPDRLHLGARLRVIPSEHISAVPIEEGRDPVVGDAMHVYRSVPNCSITAQNCWKSCSVGF
jgi:uncharacterized membrane protein YeiH